MAVSYSSFAFMESSKCPVVQEYIAFIHQFQYHDSNSEVEGSTTLGNSTHTGRAKIMGHFYQHVIISIPGCCKHSLPVVNPSTRQIIIIIITMNEDLNSGCRHDFLFLTV
jgi:hypothetical protein